MGRLQAMTALERRVNMAAVFLPFAVTARRHPAALGRLAGLVGRRRVRLHVPDQWTGRDRRLPPDADPPCLPDAQGHPLPVRLYGDAVGAGPGHRLGRRPPQASRAHRRRGRSAFAARRPRRRRPGRAAAGSGTPTPPGSGAPTARPAPTSTPRTSSRTAACASSTAKFPLIVVASLAIPAVLGGLLTMSWHGALTGLIWGGFVRIFLQHHVTWSVNSVCHFFGKRRFDVDDHSTNVFWLAIPSFGESLAPQPPHVPALGRARPALVGDRPLRDVHRAACGASASRGTS